MLVAVAVGRGVTVGRGVGVPVEVAVGGRGILVGDREGVGVDRAEQATPTTSNRTVAASQVLENEPLDCRTLVSGAGKFASGHVSSVGHNPAL